MTEECQEMLTYLCSLIEPPNTFAMGGEVKRRAEVLESKFPEYQGLSAGVRAEFARLKAAALAQRQSSSSSEKPAELPTTGTAGATPAASRTPASRAPTGRRASSSPGA